MTTDTQLAPTDAEIADLWCDSRPNRFEAISFARSVLAKWGAQPVAREPLTDEQIFDCVNVALPGKGHRVISETDPEYAKDVGIEPGARRIVSEVHPEHSIAFARAIERAHGIT